MPNILDENGLQVATRAELLEYYTAQYQAIYGSDIDLDSDTPDGQWLNLIIQQVLDLQDLLVTIYNGFDPDNAIGVVLDQRVALNGIQRQAGTYTVTDITLVNSQSVNLYGLDQSENDVYTIADSAGTEWNLISSELGLAPGTHTLSFRAAVPGAQLTIPNTITIPVTIVVGVTSVNNPTTYTTLGVDEESDAELKIRRQASVAGPSQGYMAGLLAALLNINGIESARIYENNTSATSTGSVPPYVPADIPSHSIWVVVDGTPAPSIAAAWSAVIEYSYGQLASDSGINYISIQDGNLNNAVSDTAWWKVHSPIAQTIYSKRNAGCGMKGDESYTIIQIDGTPFVVRWDVVTSEDLYIEVEVGSLNQINPPDITGIIEGIVENFVPGAYEEVNVTALGTVIQAADSNTYVSSAGFGLTELTATSLTLTPTTASQKFAVEAARVIVLPIILWGQDAVTEDGVGYEFDAVTGLVTETTASVADGEDFNFAALGGYGTYTYSMVSGTGSVNSSTGVYTANGVGTDVVQVEDDNGNVATCTVTVT